MNIVRNRSTLGQFPGEGIASDITLGPQDTSTDNFPMYNDPGLILAEQGATTSAPAPSVPQPPSSPSPVYATFGPAGTTVPSLMTATPQVPQSPAPRVNIPVTSSQQFAASLGKLTPFAWIGIGLFAVLTLAQAGGKRRR